MWILTEQRISEAVGDAKQALHTGFQKLLVNIDEHSIWEDTDPINIVKQSVSVWLA